VPTDDQGRFRFATIKPGRVPAPGGGMQAPHLNVMIFMRGLLKQLITRIYFPDDPANAEDRCAAKRSRGTARHVDRQTRRWTAGRAFL
jgi:protocatechuate 3,4-dioxygenase beta subunit